MIRMRPRTTSRRALLYWYGRHFYARSSTRRARRTDTRRPAWNRAAPRRCPRRSGPPSQQRAAVLASGGGTQRAAHADPPAPVPEVVVFLVLEAGPASSSESCEVRDRASNSHINARAAGSLSGACTQHRSVVLLGRPSGCPARTAGVSACSRRLLWYKRRLSLLAQLILCSALHPAPPARRPANIGARSFVERDLRTGSGEP